MNTLANTCCATGRVHTPRPLSSNSFDLVETCRHRSTWSVNSHKNSVIKQARELNALYSHCVGMRPIKELNVSEIVQARGKLQQLQSQHCMKGELREQRRQCMVYAKKSMQTLNVFVQKTNSTVDCVADIKNSGIENERKCKHIHTYTSATCVYFVMLI